MKKAPEAFRTISEVSDLLDTPAHVLRFWESKFYQIRPVKRAGGRRYYRPDDVALLAGIRQLLQDQGITIRGVQKVLQEQGVRHVASLAPDMMAMDIEDDAPLQAPEPAPEVIATRTPRPRPPRAPLPIRDLDEVEATFPDDIDEDFGTREPREPDDFVQGPPPAPRAPEMVPRDHYNDPEPERTDDVGASEDSVAAEGAAEDDADGVAVGADAEASNIPSPAKDPSPRRPAASAPPARPVVRAPDPVDAVLYQDESAERVRLAQTLRHTSRNALAANRGKAELLARRIDALLDRMSEASGAGRW